MLYFKYNTAEEVKNELQDRLNGINAEIAAWREVTIDRKKDGSEFAQIGRAIKGAKLSTEYPAHDAAHPVLYVYFKNGNKYENNYINAFYFCDEMPDKGASRETVYNGGFIRATSPMTAKELRQAITAHIAKLEKLAEAYEKQITICEKAFAVYRQKITEAEKELKALCDTTKRPEQIGETSLYYEITRIR